MANSAPAVSTTESNKSTSVEDVLLARGLISQKQIDFVRSEAKNRQETSEKIISSMGWVSDEDMAGARAQVLGVPYVAPDRKPISPEVLGNLPEEVAKKFTVIPIGKSGNVLEVAMVDPLDLQTIEFIEKKSGFSVKPYLATAKSINLAIADQYARGLSTEVTEALKEAAPGDSRAYVQQADATMVLGQAPVARIV